MTCRKFLHPALVTFPRSQNLELIQGGTNSGILRIYSNNGCNGCSTGNFFLNQSPAPGCAVAPVTRLRTGTSWNLMWDHAHKAIHVEWECVVITLFAQKCLSKFHKWLKEFITVDTLYRFSDLSNVVWKTSYGISTTTEAATQTSSFRAYTGCPLRLISRTS